MMPATSNPIEKVRRAFEEAYNAGDAAALAAVHTVDAVFIPPDAPVCVGPAAIQAYYRPRFERYSNTIRLTIDEAEVFTDWGYARGEFTTTATPKSGGESRQFKGKWLNICRAESYGSWKIARHMSSLPVDLPF